jgi:hypothetical protein
MSHQVGLDRIFTPEEDGEPWASVFTPALAGALDAVLGQDRCGARTITHHTNILTPFVSFCLFLTPCAHIVLFCLSLSLSISLSL